MWSAGDWEMISGQIEIEKFANREEFDLVLTNPKDRINQAFYENICLNDALRILDVYIQDVNDVMFNQQMLEIYGQCEQDQEISYTNEDAVEQKYIQFNLKDLRVLRADGNCKFATAVHGSFYIYFVYFTS